MIDAPPVLAVDVGGTKLAAGLVAGDGTVRRVRQRPTGGGDPAAAEPVWLDLCDLLGEVRNGTEISGVCVGSCGPMDKALGELSPLYIPAWRAFPLRARLMDAFPDGPVHLHNDGVAFAVGEHWVGAGRGVRDMVGLVISTGVGGGLVLDNRVRDGVSGNAGHIGHLVVDPRGPECGCGGYGCLESIASGPAVVAWAQEQGWVPRADAAASARTLADMARSGDPLSVAALTRAGEAVGVALASTAQLLDVQTFVVGGGLSEAGELIFESMRATAARHARLEFAADLRILPSRLGVRASLAGAAASIVRPDYWAADRSSD